MRKSITLVELIIAMSLLAVIVMGAGAFNLASSEMLQSSETRTQVLNELTFVLEHIAKNVSLATGDIDNPGIAATDLGVGQFRLDVNQDVSDPASYADDRTVRYNFDLGTGRIDFEGTQVLTDGFFQEAGLAFSIAAGEGVGGANGGVEITNLAVVLDPFSALDDRDNPVVTTADINGNPTVFFFPLSHSWN